MPREIARTCAFFFAALALAVSGCAAVRYPGEERSIQDYDYCIVNERDSAGYVKQAKGILSQSFIVIDSNDPRLSRGSVRRRTCEVVVNWTRGFFSVTGWVEVDDYETGDYVTIVQTRRGFLYLGAEANVLESLQTLASARKEGPPLPSSDLDSANGTEGMGVDGAQSPPSELEERLEEIDVLHDRGVITTREREAAREAILTGN